MVSTSTVKYYSGTAIVLELSFGTLVCCVSILVLVGYFKCHGWKKPSGLTVINLLAADLINGLIAPLQAGYIHCLLHDIKAADLFRTIFFLQGLFIWASPLIIILLNISRLIAILNPFQYRGIITHRASGIILTLIWTTGILNCFLKRYLSGYSKYKYYVPGVLLHLILNVIIFGLALYTLLLLRTSHGLTQSDSRVRATKTVVIVSIAYFLTYGYYIYVNVVWMIPGLAYNTDNPLLIFTAIGKWSLSIAHLFLLMNSLFNCVLLGLQPNIRHAIENIWVPVYY
jgi:hypothetical protein